jgi:hypothetical protein
MLGGDVNTVRMVLADLDKGTFHKEKVWLLGHDVENEKPTLCRNIYGVCSRFLAFVCLFVFTVITHPIFYMVHAGLFAVFSRKEKLIKCVNLPMVFAVMSRTPAEMMTILHKHGVSVCSQDKNGNNIFHYLVSLSLENSQLACKKVDTVLCFINDKITGKDLIFSRRNRQWLSSFDYAAKYGSLNIIRHITQHPFLSERQFPDPLISTNERGSETILPCEGISTARVNLVDVTLYEKGTLQARSYFLNLLSQLNMEKLHSAEVTIFCINPFIQQWCQIKTTCITYVLIVRQSLDIFVTLFIFVYVVSLERYPKLNANAIGKIVMHEIHALAINNTMFFNDEILHENIAETFDVDTIIINAYYNVSCSRLTTITNKLYSIDRVTDDLMKYSCYDCFNTPFCNIG